MFRLTILVSLLFLSCSKVSNSAFETLNNSSYWEPVNASPFGVGKGNEWALMLMDNSWRQVIIRTYTPWEREKTKASVYLSASPNPEIRSEITPNSAEEKTLMEILESLHYQEHQKVFEPVVNEFIETLSDRSKFVYEPEEI